MKKRSPHDPLAANAMLGDLKTLKKKMEAEEEARKAEEKARVEAGKTKIKAASKPSVSARQILARESNPLQDMRTFEVAMSGVKPLDSTKSHRVSSGDSADKPRLQSVLAGIVERRRRAEGGPSLRLAWHPDGTVHAAHRGREFALEALERFATPEARLDLHGLDGSTARSRVADFVRGKRANKLRCVLIVTGYGKNSPDGASVLLDAAVEELQTAPTSGELDAFASASPNHGGRGALLVALRPLSPSPIPSQRAM
jgi:DNA-nicking Smr family endonuclease